jgi:hypothetical protein
VSGVTVQPPSQVAMTIRRHLADIESGSTPACAEGDLLADYMLQQAYGIAVWCEEYARLTTALARAEEPAQPPLAKAMRGLTAEQLAQARDPRRRPEDPNECQEC